jgi:nicotinamide mononucleotide transporter PnuC
MRITNPFKTFKPLDYIVWFSSLAIILVSSLVAKEKNALSIITSLIGASSLIFVAKGHPIGQFIIIIFATLYGIKSLTFHYYGEFITYVFMSLPVALLTAISWLKHPFEKGQGEVKVENLNAKKWLTLVFSTIVVTTIFYFVLKALSTPNLIVSTISIATSFSACMMLLFRSPYYAVFYGVNDIVLIVLWSMAYKQDITYLPLVVCFCVFLLNDTYGFISWLLMKKHQQKLLNEEN